MSKFFKVIHDNARSNITLIDNVYIKGIKLDSNDEVRVYNYKLNKGCNFESTVIVNNIPTEKASVLVRCENNMIYVGDLRFKIPYHIIEKFREFLKNTPFGSYIDIGFRENLIDADGKYKFTTVLVKIYYE